MKGTFSVFLCRGLDRPGQAMGRGLTGEDRDEGREFSKPGASSTLENKPTELRAEPGVGYWLTLNRPSLNSMQRHGGAPSA